MSTQLVAAVGGVVGATVIASSWSDPASPLGALIRSCKNSLSGVVDKLVALHRAGSRSAWVVSTLVSLGLLYIAVRKVYKAYFAKYPFDTTQTSVEEAYDYIVVGGGSGGAAVAARLSENGKYTVLLLEAGGEDDNAEVKVPAAAMKLQNSGQDWCYRTTPQKKACQNAVENRCMWPRGKCLGGCSSINYMLFVRGAPADYDSWAKLTGDDRWNFQNCLPFFKKLEDTNTRIPTSKEFRGYGGPMHCNTVQAPQEPTYRFLQAAQQVGLKKLDDYNGADLFGVGIAQTNIKNGERWNTSWAYIKPALTRPNFHVLTHAHVTRVLFNNDKEAVGVAIKHGSTDMNILKTLPDRYIKAKREVVLAAGAVGSPHILLLSGVGPKQQLDKFGIPVVADLPVGENLRDHLSLPVFFESKIPTVSARDETVGNIFNWLVKGDGPLTSNFVEALGWLRTPAADASGAPAGAPDLQYHFLSGTVGADDLRNFNSRTEIREAYRAHVTNNNAYTHAVMPTLLHPKSIGYIQLQSKDPFQSPIIEANYLTDMADVNTLVEGCKLAEKIYEQSPLKTITKAYLGDKMVPNNPYNRATQPDLYWEHYARHMANTLYHPVGTCKMGAVNDPSAVVDTELRVLGVKKLRVADASIMPHLVSGNTNVPAIMVGERAADFILNAASTPTAKTKKPLPSPPQQAKL